ncbi:hypothetical protein OKW21_003191 [Catalinimonas alkaloidigena]|uniref:hypothetical protein n=1 Tax=Catalinimonas alkaloidigena TaxID=1075417 RepID=UPI002406F66A|nr:hypothetical protein [Catalinimonas alkaloidigena]MDF9797928.1 hypothetical protein [Catalinimonas alkaloidigena]
MSIDASVQQLAAGIAALLAGWLIFETVDGRLQHFDHIGWLVSIFMLISTVLMWYIHISIRQVASSAYSKFK